MRARGAGLAMVMALAVITVLWQGRITDILFTSGSL